MCLGAGGPGRMRSPAIAPKVTFAATCFHRAIPLRNWPAPRSSGQIGHLILPSQTSCRAKRSQHALEQSRPGVAEAAPQAPTGLQIPSI
jgi:hypothetical protein